MATVAIRRRKLYEDVADHLDKMIQAGAYSPSDLLPSERDLMKHFGVGRPAVREALFHLRKMGVVELRSGERARVTRPTPQLVINALSGTARHMLAAPERGAGISERPGLLRGWPCTPRRQLRDQSRRSPTSRPRWTAIAQSIGDLDRFQKTDVAFHYVLAVISGNPIFLAIHAAFAEWLLEQRKTTLACGRGSDRPTRRIARFSRRSPREIPIAPRRRCAPISTMSRGATADIVERRG